MRAMILAAGRGERLRPLTDTIPKPLLAVGKRTLIETTILRLREAGYHELVINLAHLPEKIMDHLGDGHRLGVTIRYSLESEGALETAGGIHKALPWLGEAVFLVMNGDVLCDHPLEPPRLDAQTLGHLVLVPNPPHHPEGDFALEESRVTIQAVKPYTFTGIAWYRPEFFRDLLPGPQRLGPLLREAASKGYLRGEIYTGNWLDVGTPERLSTANALWDRD